MISHRNWVKKNKLHWSLVLCESPWFVQISVAVHFQNPDNSVDLLPYPQDKLVAQSFKIFSKLRSLVVPGSDSIFRSEGETTLAFHSEQSGIKYTRNAEDFTVHIA